MKKLKSLVLLAALLLLSVSSLADIRSTTVATDPAGNVTTSVFFGPFPYSISQNKGSGSLLSLTEFCYNGAGHPCAPSGVTLPVTQKDAFSTITGVSGSSQATTTYNTYGLPLDTKLYNFGPTLVSEQSITYSGVANATIKDLPGDVLTKNHSGTTVAHFTGTFDGSGNLLTRNTLVTGSTYLTETFTYNSKGVTATSTGVNGAQTTYTNGACGGTEPTSITYPITGSETFTWDCSAGVVTAVTDVNGKTYTMAYGDPFNRQTLGTDANGVTTKYAYTPTSYEVSSSLLDEVATFNAAGRPIATQILGTGGYDTSSQSYDTMGRKTTSSLPCVSSLHRPCSSVQTRATYDSGSVPTTTLSDGLGGLITTTYTAGVETTIVSPAPTGESTKGRQYQYDGLGRLVSVCEISNGFGSGSCGQRLAQTGFATTYTYDDLGNILTITQGSQTRSMTYDDLGRVLTSTLPETGLSTYTYDSSSDCSSTSNGDILERVDAAGNTTCYKYDSASRLTSITYSGPNTTDSTFYVYDTATVNSVPMQNGKGRLVEAYTCTSCPGTKKTDVGYSYNAVGQITDVYQSTTNSGGYYHLALTLYSNQSISSLTLTPAVIPVITYGVDGEGRTSSVQAGNSSLVTSTSRGSANQVTAIAFGTGTDVYGYDANLNMNSYSLSVNGNSITGSIKYNPNGTVASKTVNDPFTQANNESCAYSYDAMVRLSTANCGTVNQIFNYDRYGNISKTGTFSFTPTYSATTNRITSGSFTYDSNGNILTDGTSTYTWDTEGRMLSGPGVDSILYNAFGQVAETTVGATHQQSVYFPSGEKLALMNGQSLVLARVPLTGGAQAVYTNAGLSYYSHIDNQGSVRLTTAASGSLSSDLAYAPFGEPYNNAGVPQSVLNFTGDNQDTVAGLYDTPTRKYNPAQSRWVSADQLGEQRGTDPQTFNLYSYSTNRPFDLFDPSGAEGEDTGADLPYGPGLGGTVQDPSSYDPYGFLNADNQGEGPLVYNAGGPAGGSGGSYSTLTTTMQTLGNIDPIGLTTSDLSFMGDVFTVGANQAARVTSNDYMIGAYEGADNVIMRVWRGLSEATGSGINSLKDVEELSYKVLDNYGSLFKGEGGDRLALGLTNPFRTREEVRAAARIPGFRSGLNAWAETVNAKTYSGFPDYNGNVGLLPSIHQLMDRIVERGGTIHFNLDGLEDIPAAVAKKSNGGIWVDSYKENLFGKPIMIKVPYNNGITIEELRYLKQNWVKFRPSTYFYVNGQMKTLNLPGGTPFVPWE